MRMFVSRRHLVRAIANLVQPNRPCKSASPFETAALAALVGCAKANACLSSPHGVELSMLDRVGRSIGEGGLHTSKPVVDYCR